ncbi:hypothetical protein ACF0H5_011661 [Mactra antiquata]
MESGQTNENVMSSDHIQQSDILAPHYIIVEDPISVHSYADLSGVSLHSDLTASVQVVQGMNTGTGVECAKNSTLLTSEEFEKKIISSNDVNCKVNKTETILAIPDLSERKSTLGNNDKCISEFENPFVASINAIDELNSDNGAIQNELMSNGSDTKHNYHVENIKILQQVNAESENDTNGKTSENDQDKTMFSENLGLIPAKSEEKIIAQRAKKAQVGVRTRKSLEIGIPEKISKMITFPQHPPNDLPVSTLTPMPGHKHKPGCYRCGSCQRAFATICKLHDHFQDHCVGGSYHYDHLLKTAFPKYDTACSYTQTPDNFVKEADTCTEISFKVKKRKVSKKMNLTKSSMKRAMPPARKLKSILGKRKPGRPKKEENIKETFEDTAVEDDIEEEEPVSEEMQISLEIVNDEDNDDTDMFAKEQFLNESLDLMNKIDGTDQDDKGTTIKDENEVEDVIEDSTNTGVVDPEFKQKSPARKRKMSIPRKITKKGDEKIVNSRSKPGNKIKCDFCPCEFQYTRGLIRHEQEKHADEMKFECDQCEQKFMREYNLERHKLCSHNHCKSRYSDDGKDSPRVKGGKKEASKKSPGKLAETKSICMICGNEVFDSKMDIHVRLHTGERPFICHVCGKGLISDKKLKRHLLIHSNKPRHTCEVCGEGFAMKYKLLTHMFIHTGHKPYLCAVCGAEFNNSTSLLHHNRTVHLGDKRFECTVCGGRYGKKSQLEEHMFSHSDERTQTCRYCGKTFKHAKSLRRHELTHVSDMKFECDQCDSKFSRKDNLERHKMCHFETTLQCSFCKKKFRDRQPLLDHEQFHINQKKHQCQICKDKFQDENYFYNHMEKVHGITKDMVPVVNAIANSPEKEPKSRKSFRNSGQNAIVDRLKLDQESDQLGLPESRTVDTLNKCMSAAGILPTTSANLGLGNMNQSSTQVGSQTQLLNPMFNVGINSMGMPQVVSNTNVHQNFTSAVTVGPNINTTQRISLSTINVGENGTIQLALDQPEATLTLGSESTILSDQARLMLNVSAIHNLQGQEYRMPNMY